MRARNVLLALIIIAVGMTITASRRGVFADWRQAISLDDMVTLASVFGVPAGEWEEVQTYSQDIPTDGARKVRIKNPNGNVTVTGRGQNQIQDQMEIEVVAYGRGETTAQALARSRKARLIAHRSGSSVTVRVEGGKNFWQHARLDLEITAPPNLDVTVGSASGSVEVKQIRGQANVSTASGDITVDGASQAECATASGSLNVSRIAGPVDARSVSGSVTLEKVAGETKAKSISGSIRATGLDGRLSAETVSGDIVAQEYRGSAATLSTTSGKVDASLGLTDIVQFSAHTISGSIWVTIPPYPECVMDLHSVSGTVTTEVSLPRTASRERGRVRAILGDGTGRLELRSISGSIKVTELGRRVDSPPPARPRVSREPARPRAPESPPPPQPPAR